MMLRKVTVILSLFLIGCNSPMPKENASMMDVRSQNIEVASDEWDEHPFFDDIEPTTFDSLSEVIQSADSIVAYNWNGNSGNPANVNHYILDKHGKFDVQVGRNIVLNHSQKVTLKELLTDSANYSENSGMCFIPHIAFVYYQKNKITGQSSVCFLCSGIKSIPKLTMALSEKGNADIKGFCREIGLKIVDDQSELSH